MYVQSGGAMTKHVAVRNQYYYEHGSQDLLEIEEKRGIKCTNTSSGKMYAKIRSLEYTKRKGLASPDYNKSGNYEKIKVNDDGGIYVHSRTKVGADPMDITLIPKSKFIQGHTL